MSRRISNAALAAAVLSIAASASWAGGNDQNSTGLPTYPHDANRRMDAAVRMLPNGQHCTHYTSNTPDALATVIAWYKKALPQAKAEDVNKDSLYGSYFKLDGIKLLLGNDIVNVYRMGKTDATTVIGRAAKTASTSIELFKCKDAANPKHDD